MISALNWDRRSSCWPMLIVSSKHCLHFKLVSPSSSAVSMKHNPLGSLVDNNRMSAATNWLFSNLIISPTLKVWRKLSFNYVVRLVGKGWLDLLSSIIHRSIYTPEHLTISPRWVYHSLKSLIFYYSLENPTSVFAIKVTRTLYQSWWLVTN